MEKERGLEFHSKEKILERSSSSLLLPSGFWLGGRERRPSISHKSWPCTLIKKTLGEKRKEEREKEPTFACFPFFPTRR